MRTLVHDGSLNQIYTNGKCKCASAVCVLTLPGAVSDVAAAESREAEGLIRIMTATPNCCERTCVCVLMGTYSNSKLLDDFLVHIFGLVFILTIRLY